jgi:hypothetical protein
MDREKSDGNSADMSLLSALLTARREKDFCIR